MDRDALPVEGSTGLVAFDYDGQEEDELTIREGDRFTLLRAFEDGWWHVEVNGSDGMIPSNYARVDAQRTKGGTGRTRPQDELVTSFDDKLKSNRSSSGRQNAQDQGATADIRQGEGSFSPQFVEENRSPERVVVKKSSKKFLLQSPPPMFNEEESPRDAPLDIPPELEATPRDGLGSKGSTLVGQSPELRRLKDLREQASKKINALRSTVSQNEQEGDSRMSLRRQRTVPPSSDDLALVPTHDKILIPRAESPSLRKNKSEAILKHVGLPHAEPKPHLHSAHGSHQQHQEHSPSSSGHDARLQHSARASQSHAPVVSAGPHLAPSSSGHSGSPQQIAQVTVDPSSIEYISKIVNEKIARALSARDRRLLQQVRELVDDTVAHISPQKPLDGVLRSKSGEPGLEVDTGMDPPRRLQPHSADARRHSGGGGGPSKIPRIKLPKVAPSAQESSSARSTGKASGTKPAVISLPAVGGKSKGPDGTPVKPRRSEDKVSEEGVQYSQCRSVVYPSVVDLDLVRQRNATGVVTAPQLALSHVLGYDGDPHRHGNAVTGKNVLFLSDSHIAFPAAAIVTVLDLRSARQAFFCGHSDDVVCLAAHPSQTCVASAQIGAESNLVLLWDYSGLARGTQALASANYELSIPSSTRGVTSLSFSGDGEYLLACGLEDSKTAYLFDWQRETLLVSAKTGHVDVSKFLFNPHACVPFQDERRTSEMKYASGVKARDAPLALPGCYTLVSFGGKQVKFWTLKQEIQYGGAGAGAEGPAGRDYRGKKFRESVLRFALEGGLGGAVKKAGGAPDYSCCAFLKAGPRGVAQTLLGASNGSIYVWQHVEDEPVSPALGEGPADFVPSWAPRGKLVLVIAEAHDSPLTDLDFFFRPSVGKGPRSVVDGAMLVSADSAGTVNIWAVKGAASGAVAAGGMPLEHMGGVQLDESHARSVCFSESGAAVAVGTASNAVVLLSLSQAGGPSGFNAELSKLLVGHNGKVRKLAVHPAVPSLFASICSDRTIRLWDGAAGRHLCSLQVEFSPSALSFSSRGDALAVGGDNGVLVVVRSEAFDALVQMVRGAGGRCDDYLEDFQQAQWEVVENKLIANVVGGGQKKGVKKTEVNEIRYSPSGDVVAVGCKDALIHVLSCATGAGYRHLGTCRGHSSQVRNLDFSEDGALLRSCDASKELLHWDMDGFQRITQPSAYRNQRWRTHSCVFGWGLQGIFNRADGDKPLPSDSEINCVCRSDNGRVVVAAGSNVVRSAIKAFDYPALQSAVPAQFGGHSSPVLDLAFIETPSGTRLVSAGGNDSCICLWDVSM